MTQKRTGARPNSWMARLFYYTPNDNTLNDNTLNNTPDQSETTPGRPWDDSKEK